MYPTYHRQPSGRMITIESTYRPVIYRNRYPKAHTYGPRRKTAMFEAWVAKQKAMELALSKRKPKNKASSLGKVLKFAVPNAFAMTKTNNEDIIKTIPQPVVTKKADLVWPLRNYYTRLDGLTA